MSELAPSTDAQLATDFSAALKEPALGTGSLSRSEIEAVLQASPRIASRNVTTLRCETRTPFGRPVEPEV